MSVVDQIKARLDIVDVINGYASLKKAGRNYKALCPFHAEKTPSFIVFPDSQTWRCFGQCNEGGDVFSFVMKREGWDFNETLRELAGRAGVELQAYEHRSEQEVDKDQRLHTLLNIAAEFFTDALVGSPAEAYIAKRGLTPETAQEFGIGYAHDEWSAALDHLTQLGFTVEEVIESGVAIHNEERGRTYDRFRHRLMIPIRDSRGQVIGFGARALEADQEPKYLNSPQGPLFDKSRTLYGLDVARRAIRENETAVIVEGYMDVIQAHQAGYKNVVAQMGTALTEDQLHLLKKYANRLILSLDTDAAGIKATMRGLEVARETLGDEKTYVVDTQGMMRQAGRLNLDIRVMELPHGKDPDDFLRATPELWPEQIKKALPLAEYVIKVGTADLPTNASIAEREIRAQELLPLLTATEDNLQNHNNVQLLSHRLRLDPKTMVQWAISRTRQTPETAVSDSRQRVNRQRHSARRASSTPTKISPSMRGRELEKYCLSELLRNPQRLYEINRLLREVGSKIDESMAQPLELHDFSQGDLQLIFTLLEEACQQEALEPLDYLLEYADHELRDLLDELLPEPLVLFAEKVGRLHVTELNSVQREQKERPWQTNREELPQLILKLRRDRIQQENKEIYFLLAEAQELGDQEIETMYIQRSQHLKKSLLVLDLAIKEIQQGSKS